MAAGPLKALDKFGPVGRNVVLFGVPAVGVMALVARSRGGAGVQLAGGPEGTGPQPVGGGGVGPDAIANLGNYFTGLYEHIIGEIGAVNARLDAGQVPQPTGQPSPTVSVPTQVAPAPQVPAAQTAPTVPGVDHATVVRHTRRVTELASRPGMGDYAVTATTPTEQGGLTTVLKSSDGRRTFERTTPADHIRQARLDFAAGRITKEEMKRRQGRA